MPVVDPNLRTTIVHAFAVTVVDQSSSQRSDPARSTDDPSSTSGSGTRGPSILPDVGHVVGGLYRLGRLLGQGMFGKVYVAQRVDVPEHQVALKLMPRSLYAMRNVERELVMLATVGHPHVVQLKDHGMNAEYVWLTMPVYEGETLAQRLQRSPLSLREAYDIFLPVARGLEALHRAGLRHQDVKPDNIFLARFSGRLHPILLDLGVAAEREASFCAGTALYASPEQLRALNGFPGIVPLSERMDTYGLATTLLYSLVNPRDFPGESAQTRTELAEAHDVRADKPLVDNALPDLTGRPREMFQEALRRWLAIDPNERPTMTQLAEELDVLLEPEREAEREAEQLRIKQKTSYLRVRIAAGAMTLVGCAVVLLGVSKRETLRLANELEQARQKGAESFDKLDTCVASHQIAAAEVNACRGARAQDRADFNQTLATLQKTGSMTEAEHAREIQALHATHASRLKTCEESAAAAEKVSMETRERLAEAEKARAALVTERDEAKVLAEQRAAELAVASQLRAACDAERASCIAERDRLKAQPADPGSAPASPAPAASSGASPQLPSPAGNTGAAPAEGNPTVPAAPAASTPIPAAPP
ncbi:protein kinase [Sorangium cellulosum]|uniref:Protein kinase n=1 Tax=Sorangium cellulosum TaxID=56 RepID=A0A2L0ELG9_SORCE|nr:serine/threonine-protein kinase [Sorangium cellulosum]AUX40137.1 protein kinase [Sorangium cellulosum]